MRTYRLIAAFAALLPLTAWAQTPDTLQLGDRVRVRVAATRGAVNLFVGNVAAVTHDTLTLTIPGGKGTIIMPRASVSEIAIADGRESRWKNVLQVAPLFPLLTMTASLPTTHGPHAQSLRNQKYALLTLNGLLIGRGLLRATPERWRPLYSWLDRP